jgi:hypothetical protein
MLHRLLLLLLLVLVLLMLMMVLFAVTLVLALVLLQPHALEEHQLHQHCLVLPRQEAHRDQMQGAGCLQCCER